VKVSYRVLTITTFLLNYVVDWQFKNYVLLFLHSTLVRNIRLFPELCGYLTIYPENGITILEYKYLRIRYCVISLAKWLEPKIRMAVGQGLK
jgi:hypothetical protein